jgi:hypothetical protein
MRQHGQRIHFHCTTGVALFLSIIVRLPAQRANAAGRRQNVGRMGDVCFIVCVHAGAAWRAMRMGGHTRVSSGRSSAGGGAVTPSPEVTTTRASGWPTRSKVDCSLQSLKGCAVGTAIPVRNIMKDSCTLHVIDCRRSSAENDSVASI